ncbi:methyltransferase [Nocardia sp. NPDC004722]
MSSSDTDTLVARLRAAGCVFAEDEAALLLSAATDAAQLESLVTQRIAGFPLEHLLGWAEFRDLRVKVAPGVFVPRQRTGFLVEEAIMLGRRRIESAGQPVADDPITRRIASPSSSSTEPVAAHRTPRDPAVRSPIRARSADVAGVGSSIGDTPLSAVGAAPDATSGQMLIALDMCCGCGALGLALAAELAGDGIRVELTAADIEPAAAACARDNLTVVGGRVFEGDLFEAVPSDLRGRVDILLANTPYVPSAEIAWMPPEARDHEPRRALDGGADGLDVLRRIAAVAGDWLAPGGHLLVEESEEQAPVAAEVMRAHGLRARIAECEELGATVVIGTRA